MTENKIENKPNPDSIFKKVGRTVKNLFTRDLEPEDAKKLSVTARTGRILLESFSVLLTLGLVFFGSLTFLLNRASVDLAFFKPHYEQWFSEAFDGRSTNIENYSAKWLEGRRAVEVTVEDVEIIGQDENAQKIEMIKGEFAFGANFLDRPALRRLDIDGGALTISRTEDGTFLLGLGTPQTFEKVAPLWSSENLQNSSDDANVLQTLEAIAVENATIYLQDAIYGIDLEFRNIDGYFDFDGKYLDITGSGEIIASGENSPFSMHLRSTLDRSDFVGQLSVKQINPIHIAPNSGPYEIIGNLDAKVDVDTEISFLPDQGFQDLSLVFSAGEGQLLTGTTFKPFENAVINASYNSSSETVQITELEIESLALNVVAEGQLDNIGTPATGFLVQPFDYEFDIGQLRLNPGVKFDGPLSVKSGVLTGRIDLTNRIYEFTELDADFGDFQTDLSGKLIRNENGDFSEIRANGVINGAMKPSQLLGFWPNNAALGARDWIRKAVKDATLENLDLDLLIDENDFENQFVANDHIELKFDVKDATVHYMEFLPWLREASGSGVLRGNRLEFLLDSGRVDAVRISNGVIDIPRLLPKGGDLTIDIEGVGSASEMMRITNFPPFGYADRFRMNPKDIGGSGNIDLKITRPLLEFFDRERIRYDLTGKFADVTLPVGVGAFQLNSGELEMIAGKTGITIDGPIRLGNWESTLHWDKKLGEPAQPATYDITGVVDRDDLDSFGIGLRRHFGGEIGLKLSGVGDGLEVPRIQVDADFKNADMNIGSLWQKQKGEAGDLSGLFVLDGQAGALLQDFTAKSNDLSLEGSLSLASDFKLKNLDIKKAEISGFVDASVQAKPTEDGVLSMFLTGDYLNVEPWVDQAFKTQTSAVNAPIRLTASIKKLSLNENLELADASALFSHDGTATQQARLKGQTPEGPLSAEITSDFENGFRTVNVDIPDAGRAMLTLLGLDSITNGKLKITGKLPPSGQPGGVKGNIELSDFTLVRAPAFAQVLSLASLTGLADTLGGSGLSFNKLDSQFSWENGLLKVREGKASGPALGLTMEGDVGITNKTIDLNGVLVPSYSVNSVLGDIPLLGEIVVGKKGEGMFALNYSIKGPFSATQVSVNPLSALTPGFLRRIFDVKRDEIEDPDLKELIEQQKRDD